MAFLEGTVKLPGVGTVKKSYAAAGLAVAGAAIVITLRRRKARAAAGTAPGGDPFPPDGTTGDPTDPNSTDPATGLTYGDEQAGYGVGGGAGMSAAATDAFPWDGTYGVSGDPNSIDPGTGVTYGNEGGLGGGGSGGTGGGSGGPPFSTNAAWAAYAVQQLADTAGKDAGQVTDALGLYINGQAVTAAQRQLIEDARAIAGPPPVAGPGNFPPSIRMQGTSTGGKTTAANPVHGIHVTAIERTDATVAWKPAEHATFYSVKITTGKTTVRTQDTTTASSHIGGLKPATRYEVSVLARPAKASAHPATVSFTTQKPPMKPRPVHKPGPGRGVREHPG